MEHLELALYLLARREPDSIVLASINKDFGKEPVLRQHTHVAVLFPRFDRDGQFVVSVLERSVETSLGSLQAQHPNASVHLVRVAADGAFEPLDPGPR
jgi:hypothetical protein